METWGPVQINTEPVNTTSTLAFRDSEEDVYAFMLNDLDEAIVHLAAQATKTGHINLWAAKALRARILLYKASKFNDAVAYADAATEAEEVIAGSGCSFFANYSDIWSGSNENGISNREVIWFVEYSSVLEDNIMPVRLKLDENANQMQWSAMMIRNAANTLGWKCFSSDVCRRMELADRVSRAS